MSDDLSVASCDEMSPKLETSWRLIRDVLQISRQLVGTHRLLVALVKSHPTQSDFSTSR